MSFTMACAQILAHKLPFTSWKVTFVDVFGIVVQLMSTKMFSTSIRFAASLVCTLKATCQFARGRSAVNINRGIAMRDGIATAVPLVTHHHIEWTSSPQLMERRKLQVIRMSIMHDSLRQETTSTRPWWETVAEVEATLHLTKLRS